MLARLCRDSKNWALVLIVRKLTRYVGVLTAAGAWAQVGWIYGHLGIGHSEDDPKLLRSIQITIVL